jgi:hypothetical protein
LSRHNKSGNNSSPENRDSEGNGDGSQHVPSKSTSRMGAWQMHPTNGKSTQIPHKLNQGGEHTQFMQEHALIGKFLGLWPSERDLNKWIKHWWNPKGDYEVQLSSKGFFTIILYNLEDKITSLRMAHTSTTQQGYS